MKIEEGKFYFIKDCFWEEIKDSNLSINKGDNNKRPCYYCFKDKKESQIIWFIPISSKVEKYKRIYDEKYKKYKKVDTLIFGKVGGEERVFLIQNMFPIIEKYIQSVYERKNVDVKITYSLKQEIKDKANHILILAEKGKKVVFPDILKMKEKLLIELKR